MLLHVLLETSQLLPAATGPTGGLTLGRLFLRGFLQFARQFFHALAHDLSGLELDRRAGRNDKTAARFVWVASHARLRQARLEHAKISQLDRDIIRQATGDMVEGPLHNFKDIVLNHPCLITDGHDNVPLRELGHIHYESCPAPKMVGRNRNKICLSYAGQFRK
jgi:hypothetical protein